MYIIIKRCPKGPPREWEALLWFTYTNAQLANTVLGYSARYSIREMENMFTERRLENETESRLIDSDRANPNPNQKP